MDNIVSLIQGHTVIAIVIAVVLLFLIWRKPKLFFGILLLGLILAVVFYLITGMAGSGSQHKRRLINEEKKLSNTDH